MRYFIHIGYDGTRYKGWQRQKRTPITVQEVIEKTLFKLLKKEITVYGCGRTDAGVHASQYILHINLEEEAPANLKFLLNKNLPDGIAVYEVLAVEATQHCRYNATTRTYDYFIHWKKDPMLYRYSSFYEQEDWAFEQMQEAVQLIAQTKDFKPLCKQPNLYKNTLCKITNCALYVNEEQGRIRFSITSNRFLRGMVRYCVYFLLEIGKSRLSLTDFEQILNQKKLVFHKKPALPNGLFLSQVTYPFLEFKNAHPLIGMLKRGLE